MKRLGVVLVKPSKYAKDGSVERFRRGFMPNATLVHMKSMVPPERGGASLSVHVVDEYVETDLEYLRLLAPAGNDEVLVALVGVQSHQLHRALDLAALARSRGVRHVVVGGPHVMTCDTTGLQGRGVSFALSEAELIWDEIIDDAIAGELKPVYGDVESRWQQELRSPVLVPPSPRELRRHAVPMMGIYPARGCPYRCTFCSVIKIAGRRVRSEPVETTLASLRAAKAAGVKMVMFTSDNFNKYPQAPELLDAMIDDERARIPFFVQCDAQVVTQRELVARLARAGCWQIFVGVESLNRDTLKGVKKHQNRPGRYAEIVELCHEHRIMVHFSNIFGFPEDTAASMRAHLDALLALSPDLASFHVLTPIPGTEQYDTFKSEGLLTEPNLDRYGAGHLTWRHPNLDERALRGMQLRGYREAHAPALAVKKTREWQRRAGRVPPFGAAYLLGLYSSLWLSAMSGTPPMSGGLWRVKRDRVDDYRPLRRAAWGFELAPLPDSLPSRAPAPTATPAPTTTLAPAPAPATRLPLVGRGA